MSFFKTLVYNIKYELIAVLVSTLFFISISYMLNNTTSNRYTMDVRLLVINNVDRPVNNKIGEGLLYSGVVLEKQNQHIPVVVEYIVNRQKIIETWDIPLIILLKNVDKTTISANITYFNIDFIAKDIVAFIDVDEDRIKTHSLFSTYYNKLLSSAIDQSGR